MKPNLVVMLAFCLPHVFSISSLQVVTTLLGRQRVGQSHDASSLDTQIASVSELTPINLHVNNITHCQNDSGLIMLEAIAMLHSYRMYVTRDKGCQGLLVLGCPTKHELTCSMRDSARCHIFHVSMQPGHAETLIQSLVHHSPPPFSRVKLGVMQHERGHQHYY